MMREIAEKSEMNVICTTGFYFEEMGLPVYWRARSVEEIAELYIREITYGASATTGVRAGAIKVATGAPAITAHWNTSFSQAACIAQRATGMCRSSPTRRTARRGPNSRPHSPKAAWRRIGA